jgi:hypothetical protein
MTGMTGQELLNYICDEIVWYQELKDKIPSHKDITDINLKLCQVKIDILNNNGLYTFNDGLFPAWGLIINNQIKIYKSKYNYWTGKRCK